MVKMTVCDEDMIDVENLHTKGGHCRDATVKETLRGTMIEEGGGSSERMEDVSFSEEIERLVQGHG